MNCTKSEKPLMGICRTYINVQNSRGKLQKQHKELLNYIEKGLVQTYRQGYYGVCICSMRPINLQGASNLEKNLKKKYDNQLRADAKLVKKLQTCREQAIQKILSLPILNFFKELGRSLLR